MALEISSTLLQRLLKEAAASPEQEVCGLLFGTAERIEAAQACRNVAEDPRRHFEIDPAALFAAHRAARRGGGTILGHYHSHPSGSARPSPRDADASLPDGALWLILAGGEARLYRAVATGMLLGRFDPIDLAICADPARDPVEAHRPACTQPPASPEERHAP